MTNEEIIKKIKKALSKQPVRLAYLYGSFATGNTHRNSDVDIAVVFEKKANKADYQIAGEIHRALGGGLPEVDVREIDLDTDPVFLINTLKPARPLFVETEKERVEFETKAYQRFYDTQHLRDINFTYLKRELEEDRYGRGLPHYQKVN